MSSLLDLVGIFLVMPIKAYCMLAIMTHFIIIIIIILCLCDLYNSFTITLANQQRYWICNLVYT